MNPRFQADADLNEEIVPGLLRNHPDLDFQAAEEAGLPALEVLGRAADDLRVLVTHDRRTMPKRVRRPDLISSIGPLCRTHLLCISGTIVTRDVRVFGRDVLLCPRELSTAPPGDTQEVASNAMLPFLPHGGADSRRD